MLIETYNEVAKLDEAIERLLDAMSAINPTTDEYAKMAEHLTKLIKNKQIIAELKLKSFDALNKKEYDGLSLAQKNLELNAKQREHDANVELKKRELDLKSQDMDWRVAEASDTYELKKRELNLREKEAEKPDRVSKETWALIGANIAGIVMIIGHEKFNVIASKALGFVMKSR